MKLFCFASRNLENIRRGIAARRWAVSTASDSTNRGRRTKAARYFAPGDHGLLYCEETHSFTTPFIVASKADPDIVVKDVWPEPWVLPFSISPLGGLEKQLPANAARMRWPLIERRGCGRGGVTAALNITGVTVFSPVSITEEDWRLVLADLAS
jgi:hypothetical protein